jgi:hypothetical protein
VRTYEDLRETVLGKGGLLRVPMGDLRDIEKAGRLGKIVRDRIHTNLQHQQLGHLPVDLPNDQDDVVRIYDTRGPLGAVVAAVLNPSQAGDKLLRELSSKGAEKKLSDLRALLDEAVEILDS